MSLDDKKKINAIMVLEVLGRPPEYLIETLNNLIKAMAEEKGVAVKENKIMEPVAMKEKPDFYSSFAEIEVEVEEILHLAILMFKYMPAHVEIISPQNLNLSNAGFNDLFNELTRRLHGYEEIARILQTEKMILENQLKTILGNKEEETKKEEGKKKEAKKEKIETKPEKKIKKPRAKKTKKANGKQKVSLSHSKAMRKEEIKEEKNDN